MGVVLMMFFELLRVKTHQFLVLSLGVLEENNMSEKLIASNVYSLVQLLMVGTPSMWTSSLSYRNFFEVIGCIES